MSSKKIRILGIESSCDETAASVIEADLSGKNPKFTVLSNIAKTQIELHAKWGGVVPEIASRAHLTAIQDVTEKALRDSSSYLLSVPVSKKTGKKEAGWKKIDYIAPTTGPGLIGSLIVGTEYSKALGLTSGIPILPTNHMEGHMFSAFAENRDKLKGERSKVESKNKIQYPIASLIVSGGHTMIAIIEGEGKYKVIGNTVDDAAGEAFDKVAKLMGLPYPGGPIISKLASASLGKRDKSSTLRLGLEEVKDERSGESPDIEQLVFPRPMINSGDYNFSFSGLKTAVRYYIDALSRESRVSSNELKGSGSPQSGVPDFAMTDEVKTRIAKAFEDAVVDVLVTKTLRAVDEYNCKSISLTGGVSANKKLRETLAGKCNEKGLEFLVPPFDLCTDNAGMIAIAAYMSIRSGKQPVNPEAISADSGWEIA